MARVINEETVMLDDGRDVREGSYFEFDDPHGVFVYQGIDDDLQMHFDAVNRSTFLTSFAVDWMDFVARYQDGRIERRRPSDIEVEPAEC